MKISCIGCIQKGLNTNVNQEFLFGMYECGLYFGKTVIDDALKGELTVIRFSGI